MDFGNFGSLTQEVENKKVLQLQGLLGKLTPVFRQKCSKNGSRSNLFQGLDS